MLELCDYIYKQYPNIRNRIKYWQLLSLLDTNEDRVVTVQHDGKFKGAALYLNLTDNTLEDLKLMSKHGTRQEVLTFLSIPVNISKLFAEKGDNVHFFILIADSYKTIREGLRKVIQKEKPKNVSWFDMVTYKLKSFKGGNYGASSSSSSDGRKFSNRFSQPKKSRKECARLS